jgi:predicted TIM-barrel fold metal-dependent hydrolase
MHGQPSEHERRYRRSDRRIGTAAAHGAQFLEKYQDRIVFGTDASPASSGTPQQIFGDEMYEIYFRLLETEDEYFDYAPAKVPPQGRWRVYGLGLSEQTLRKLYFENAARRLGLPA